MTLIPIQSHSISNNPTIAKLPDEILLWIFDFYRQSFGHQLSSESYWNSRNGWFMLAHVCRNWRHIILSSPSRLRLRLCFTAKTRTRANVLMSLPSLPIIVDYLNRDRVWTDGAQNRLKSVRRHRNRVCGIAIAVTFTRFDSISKALDAYFPTLESLELDIQTGIRGCFGPRFLRTSTKSLRRLKINTRAILSSVPITIGYNGAHLSHFDRRHSFLLTVRQNAPSLLSMLALPPPS